MRDKADFLKVLGTLDRKDASAYAELRGDFDFSRYVLKISQVQGPDGVAGMLLIRVPQALAGFPRDVYATVLRRTALEDFLQRRLVAAIEHNRHFSKEGIARRRLHVPMPGQAILPRSALVVGEDYIEARVWVDLPHQRGLVSVEQARELFFEEVPAVVNQSLYYHNLDRDELAAFISTMETADSIRQLLPTRGWMSFVAEGAHLARRAGTDEPDYRDVRALSFPDELAVEIQNPEGAPIRGVGIPAGVTLILGNAYSGRIEFMHALAAGVYNHVPGDGRELVVSLPDSVYVAADPGRAVQGVDISAFVPDLPRAQSFTTPCADAVQSQAATMMEMLEAGARVLLMDEADSAPEFLSRDARTTVLATASGTAIVPLAQHVGQVARDLGVSLVVAGQVAVTELIPEADTIFMMEDYRLVDITESAKKLPIAKPGASGAVHLARPVADIVEKNRWVVPVSIDPSRGIHEVYTKAEGLERLVFGGESVSLAALRQLADVHQAATIGEIINYIKMRYLDQLRPLREILDMVDRDLSAEGLDVLSHDARGDYARARRYEIAMVLNRLPMLRTTTVD